MSNKKIFHLSKDTSKCLLELDHEEAHKFFLKSEIYCNFDLPSYFVFDDLINKIDHELQNKKINDYMHDDKRKKSNNFAKVNHVIINNKDGQYAWRPFQLIHPALYVSLVHQITKEDNWQLIRERFLYFFENSRISCMSIPLYSLDSGSDKEKQVSSWWHEVEQKSIELSLEYEYLIQTDITDCYGSIYTHAIAWALHDKSKAKKNRTDTHIGNVIDTHIKNMSYGQTNGIPQGSVLMDFIAEMVLGYADFELSEKIKNNKIKDYHIIRYRDDYRIFTNNPQEAKQIIKYLTEILIDLGLKLNTHKTQHSDQVIRNSIKQDKLYWICQKQSAKELQKHLLIIHELATRHHNSGSLEKALTTYHKKIRNIEQITPTAIKSLISIIVDIAVKNPRTYPISAAILSDFINRIDNKQETMDKITHRFSKIPHTEYLDLWLQRIILPFKLKISNDSLLCQLVTDPLAKSEKIWNNAWLKESPLKQLIEETKIVDHEIVAELPPIIQPEEVNLFSQEYY